MVDSVDLAIVQGMLEVLVLCVVVKVVIEVGIVDSVYIDMAVGSREEFLEEGVVLLSICGIDWVEVLWLITGLRDG